jgi:hypothetical protein
MAITNKDIEKLKEVFATKEDLSNLDNKLTAVLSGVLSGQDRIIKELETAREDRTLAIGKDREQDRRLGTLEQRVEKVEVKIGV